MSSAVDVEVRLKLKDGASAEMKAVVKTAEQVAAKVATATERAAKQSAEAAERGAARQRSSYERSAQARETLGIRSERVIQREIQKTEAAYGRLAKAGFASAQEQERAYAAVQSRITRLTNEMGKLTSAQSKAADEAKRLAQAEADQARRQKQIEADRARGQNILRVGAAAVAGGTAAAYTLRAPAADAIGYDKRLAGMANTAFAERDSAGRLLGMTTLETAVTSARRFGGGSRDQTAEALDAMIASGTVSVADAIQMLPGIMKASTASGAGATELATIAIRAKQSFKISADDLPKILSAAMASGQAGGFELKDMAKWLPQQMAMGGNLGLSGRAGFAKLAAWNQASVITAGTKDEAGNNLRDLLMELNTPHFKNYLAEIYLANGKKAKPGEKTQRLKDMDQVFLDYQDRGIDKVSATIDIMQKVFAKDTKYQALQAKLQGTGTDDKEGRRAIIESMSAQVQGSAVGKVFHNQQSLMAFLGLMNNQAYIQDVLGKTSAEYSIPEDRSSTSVAHSVMSSTPAYKLEQAKEDAAAAQKSAMDGLTPAIGKAAEAFADIASKYPLLTGTATLATTALGALAGAAGLATMAMGGKIPGTGAVTGALGRYGDAIANSGVAKWLGRAAGVGAAWEIGHDVIGAGVNWGINKTVQWGTGQPDASLGTWLYDKLNSGPLAEKMAPPEPKPVDVNYKAVIDLSPNLLLRSQNVQSSGGKVYTNTGNLMSGAPQ